MCVTERLHITVTPPLVAVFFGVPMAIQIIDKTLEKKLDDLAAKQPIKTSKRSLLIAIANAAASMTEEQFQSFLYRERLNDCGNGRQDQQCNS